MVKRQDLTPMMWRRKPALGTSISQKRIWHFTLGA